MAAARQTLDFGRPIALMLLGILHLIQDAEEPYQIVSHLMDALPSGSYLVISHPASDIHANQAGYGVIAQAFAAALGRL